MNILILTNGEYGDYSFCKDLERYNYIICADNGMKHARALNLLPHIIVGDFDSSNRDDLVYFEAQGVEVLRFSAEKDETDTEIALQSALVLEPHEITIYGGLGSRFDHSLGNVHLLRQALDAGIKAKLINPQNTVYLMDRELSLVGQPGDLVSLLPLTETVSGVTTKGLAYSLTEAEFRIGKPYGISNYILDGEVTVRIRTGLLIVILSKDAPSRL